jgi:hypothetical protein
MERIHTHNSSLGSTVLRASALIAIAAIATAQTPAGPHNPAPRPRPVGTQPAPDPSPAPVPFCFGDGTSAPCPCDNTGAPGRGCDNSALSGGALLWATGASKVLSDSLQLHINGMLPKSLAVVLQGDAPHTAANFGDGLRCVGGTLRRLYVANAIDGSLTVPGIAETAIWARSNELGDFITPGTERYYQVYYRDPTGRFCDFPFGDTFNVSNGMTVTWVK